MLRRIHGVRVEDALAVEIRSFSTGELLDKTQCGRWMFGAAEQLPDQTANALRRKVTFDPEAEKIN